MIGKYIQHVFLGRGISDSVMIKIGNPAPQVLWVRLGKSLEDDGYHQIYDRNGENYFEIPKISILDAGEYSCIATNMMGAAYSTFTVCVEGKIRLQNSIKNNETNNYVYFLYF